MTQHLVLVCTICTSNENKLLDMALQKVRYGFVKHVVIFLDKIPDGLTERKGFVEYVLLENATISQAKRKAIEYADFDKIEYTCFYPINALLSEEDNWLPYLLNAHRYALNCGLVGILNQHTPYTINNVPTKDYEEYEVNISESGVEGFYMLQTSKAIQYGCFTEEVDLSGFSDLLCAKKFQINGQNNFYIQNCFYYAHKLNSACIPVKKKQYAELYTEQLKEIVKK